MTFISKEWNEDINRGLKVWLIAVATAVGAYGGFPAAPHWWINLTQYKLFQYMCVWALVYQGGGSGDISYSTIISLLVYGVMSLTMDFGKVEESETGTVGDKTKAEAGVPAEVTAVDEVESVDEVDVDEEAEAGAVKEDSTGV